jgi:3-oxoacyl-[acyl-carrier-protein] synthase II
MLAPVVRAVVVGFGAVTAHGLSVAATWSGVKAGRIAVGPITKIALDDGGRAVGGEISEAVVPSADYPRRSGFREPIVDYALHAAEEAMGSAVRLTGLVSPERFGLVLGITVGGTNSSQLWYRDAFAGRPTDARLLRLVPQHGTTEIVGGVFNLRGPTVTYASACATGSMSVGAAADMIRSGRADAVLTGGTEATFAPLWFGLHRAKLISTRGARPFSLDRDGMSPGEGAAMLVLTTDALAEAAGLDWIAEVRGYGTSSDAYNRTAPDPSGAGVSRAIRMALTAAGLNAEDIDYVNAHGTGTKLNDVAETKAVRLALGARADSIPISSVKGGIGHLGGAAGAIEAIVTLKAIEEQVAPPTAAYSLPDPECDLDFVPKVREARVRAAVSTNFGFGGANAALVLAGRGAHAAPPALKRGRVVVTAVEALLPPVTNVQDGVARLTFDPTVEVPREERRHIDRLGLLSLVTSQRALAKAGFTPGPERDELGVILGTALGPMESHEAFGRPLLAEGSYDLSPALLPNQVQNAAAGYVALRLRLLGSTTTISSGHDAGGAALAHAADQIAFGRVAGLVWIAADTLTDWVVGWYRGQGLLRGMILVEGAVAAVLEAADGCRKRGGRPLA